MASGHPPIILKTYSCGHSNLLLFSGAIEKVSDARQKSPTQETTSFCLWTSKYFMRVVPSCNGHRATSVYEKRKCAICMKTAKKSINPY